MFTFTVEHQEELTFVCDSTLTQMFKLSPCVWREHDRLHLLLRVVNRSEVAAQKVARIHYGWSFDGLTFTIDPNAVIAPDEKPDGYDSGGCEDPSLAHVDGTYYVYYSGWNQHRGRGELLLASGQDIARLRKRGIALGSSENAANPKEATIVAAADGSYRLFFEYAHEGKSKIGLARAACVAGPWKVLPPPFGARPDSWDSWHLSTGPIWDSAPERPVMFYNGATRDAHWRIGWVVFDETYSRVVERSVRPLVLPHIKRNSDDTDIAFAASAVESGSDVHLYYSVADQYCVRALITAGSA